LVVDGAGHMGPLTHTRDVCAPIMRHIADAEDQCATVTPAPADIFVAV
jgi:hypothetical protein